MNKYILQILNETHINANLSDIEWAKCNEEKQSQRKELAERIKNK